MLILRVRGQVLAFVRIGVDGIAGRRGIDVSCPTHPLPNCFRPSCAHRRPASTAPNSSHYRSGTDCSPDHCCPAVRPGTASSRCTTYPRRNETRHRGQGHRPADQECRRARSRPWAQARWATKRRVCPRPGWSSTDPGPWDCCSGSGRRSPVRRPKILRRKTGYRYCRSRWSLHYRHT